VTLKRVKLDKVDVILPVKDEPYLPILLEEIKDCGLECYEVHVRTEAGLSNAVLAGVRDSHGDAVIILDADGSHQPAHLEMMLAALRVYDVVIGSRYITGAETNDSLTRQFISACFCWLSHYLLGLRVRDTMSGFVAVRRRVFEELNLNPKGYKFALEIMVKGRGKYRFAEVPIIFEKRQAGVSKADWRQALTTLRFIGSLFMWELSN
jgi:dolichol-phosphate mannosyltransferase